MQRKVLCPVDYSTASDEALASAVSMTRQLEAALLVAHVELPSPPPLGTVEPPGSGSQEDAAALTQRLEQLCTGGDRPVAYEMRMLHGDPAAEIVRLARQELVELIVMATAGRTGWRRLLMGSVAETVVRDAPCPVLTLKQPHTGTATAREAPAAPSATPTDPRAIGEAEIEFRADPAQAIAEAPARGLALLGQAVAARATDVHLDPLGGGVEIRFRVDGRLEHHCRLPREVAQPLVTQLKLMAEVDIADPFRAQEGRFSLPHPVNYEVRLTRVPVLGGESLALRLLNYESLLRPLDNLGLFGESLERLRDMLRLGEGVVLVTGPAGSGKTTTAYSMAHAMDDGHRNLVTMEDPVEYRIPSFRQMSVDSRHGVTMTSGLRSLLRMDPDVVLVGEIRDAETADIAMRAASSGKYVFTTLHTRDVASTVTALRDLHVDNRSLAGNLTGIISQRLVRRVCPSCCRQVPSDAVRGRAFSDEGVEAPASLAVPGGCKRCRNTGYFGRIGVFEVVLPDRAMRETIERGGSEDELRDQLRAAGTRSLLADALSKARDGVTTLDEVHAMTWVTFPD